MNRIYLFGKVISKSKLKYIIKPRLRLYIEIMIETIEGNIFNCIVEEGLLDEVRKLKILDYVYIKGSARSKAEKYYIYSEKIYEMK